MSINLLTQGAGSIDKHFTNTSFLKGKTGNSFQFTGAKGLRILSVQTVPLTDYTRSGQNRYGTPTELQDSVQELIMSQDKAFALTIDKGNNDDQMRVKRAGEMLRMQIDEQVVPTCDKYALERFAHLAGKIVGNSDTISSANIISKIAEGTAYFDDKAVPYGDRYIYMTGSMHNMVKMSSEFLAVESLGEKAVAKGVAGEVLGAKIVKVPSGYLPAGCQFILAHKNAVLMPWKINDAKVHTDPPGINGDLLEGRFYYDAFVLSAKCDGVYVLVDASAKLAAPTFTCQTPGTSTLSIASTGASTIKYTLDGTDPRYSTTAQVYSSAIATTGYSSGQSFTVKAVGTASGKYASDVASQTFTVA